MGLSAKTMLRLLTAHRRVTIPHLGAVERCLNRSYRVHTESIVFNDVINGKHVHPRRDYEISIRDFSRTAVTSIKYFQETENGFAHKVLVRSGSYSLVPASATDEQISRAEAESLLSQNWNSPTPKDALEAFRRLSCYAAQNSENISKEKYTALFASLAENREKLSDEELADTLRYLALWPQTNSVREPNYYLLWNSLDKECIRRTPKWSLDELLLFCDHWYNLRMVKSIEFSWYALRKMSRKLNRLTPNNLIQLMFYINVCRKNPVHMYNVEYRLESCIEDLNIDELAIVAMGFFKSQTPIRESQLLARMMRRVIDNLDTIHEISLTAIMKVMRYSMRLSETGLMWELLTNATAQVPRLSLQCLVHIALVGTNVQVYNEELMSGIAERFAKEIKNARLKDIERLVFALTMFNCIPKKNPPLVDIILRDLNSSYREEEIQRYPRCLACCLHYLSLIEVYPKHLIARVLEPDFIKNTYGPGNYRPGREILALDAGVEIEVPDYMGPRISPEMSTILAKRYTKWAPNSDRKKMSATDKFLLEVIQTCQEVLGTSTMVHVDHVLPQYERADIIVCLDEYYSPVPASLVLSELPFGSVKHRPEMFLDGQRWLALVPAGWNAYIRDSSVLLGSVQAKLRQLERIGYAPIVIPWFDWIKLRTQENKVDCIKQKLFS